MKIFLLAAAGAVAGLVAMLLLTYWVLRAKWRRFQQSLKQLATALGGGVPPFRIELEPCTEPEWDEAAACADFTAEAKRRGFREAGDFRIEAMEVNLRGFVHEDDRVCLALYQSDEAGLFADAVALMPGDVAMTVSSAPETGLERPEFSPIVHLKADLSADAIAGLTDLLEALDTHTPKENRQPVTTEGFPTLFTDAYAREMDWRVERGGVSEAEVRASAQAGGLEPPDDAQVQQVQRAWRRAICQFVEEELRQAYLKSGKISAADWDRWEDDLLLVHDRLDPRDLAQTLYWQMTDDAEDDNEDDDAAEEAEEERVRVLAEQLESAENVRAGFKRILAEHEGVCPYVLRDAISHRGWQADVYLPADA